MIGLEIKEFAENILDGYTFDETFFYQLLNIAKNKLEEERLWQYLKKLQSSQNATSGNNYATGYDLPTDFASEYKLEVGLNAEYLPVSFEEQHIYRNTSNRYYVNVGESKFYLLGNVKGDTIYLFYKRFTDDITADTSPVFPTRFHPMLGYLVAAYYQSGVDADDIFARMSPVNRAAATELKDAMESWDFTLASRAQNDRVGMEGGGEIDDLSNM